TGGAVITLIGLCTAAWQAQEFVRRVLYVEHRPTAILAVDAVSYGGQLALIAILAWAGRLTVDAGLWVVAGTSLAGAVLGGILLRGTLLHPPAMWAITRNVSYGKGF